jgi:hypothetical protein
MIADSRALRVRLGLAFGCFIVLGFLYVRALAGAAVFGTYSSFAHPWWNIGSDLLIFSLCGACLVLLASFTRYGSRLQRLAAVLLASLPLLVIGHFVLWLLK